MVSIKLSDYVENHVIDAKKMRDSDLGSLIKNNKGKFLVDCQCFNNYKVLFNIIGEDGVKNLYDNWIVEGHGFVQPFKTRLAKEHGAILRRESKALRKKGKYSWSEETELFIPYPGTAIKLTRDWDFSVDNNLSNEQILSVFGKNKSKEHVIDLTIQKGCVLIFERIEISRYYGSDIKANLVLETASDDMKVIDGLSGNEIVLTSKKTGKNLQVRFQVKLKYVNNIKCVIDKNSVLGDNHGT